MELFLRSRARCWVALAGALILGVGPFRGDLVAASGSSEIPNSAKPAAINSTSTPIGASPSVPAANQATRTPPVVSTTPGKVGNPHFSAARTTTKRASSNGHYQRTTNDPPSRRRLVLIVHPSIDTLMGKTVQPIVVAASQPSQNPREASGLPLTPYLYGYLTASTFSGWRVRVGWAAPVAGPSQLRSDNLGEKYVYVHS